MVYNCEFQTTLQDRISVLLWLTTEIALFFYSEVPTFLLFLAFNFCQFCVGHSFFLSQPQRPMTWDFYPRFYPLQFCPILILEKWSVKCQTRELLVPFFYNILDWGLNPGPPSVKTSALATARLSRRR